MAGPGVNPGIQLGEAIRKVISSPKLRSILEKFHARLEAMESGVELSGSSVTFSRARGSSVDTARDILTESLFHRLKFEIGFDESQMRTAKSVLEGASESKRELLREPEFLSRLNDLLAHTENIDDINALVTLCIEVHSMHSQVSPATLAQIENPGIVIELTKAYVGLLVASPGGAVAEASDPGTQDARPEPKPAEPAQGSELHEKAGQTKGQDAKPGATQAQDKPGPSQGQGQDTLKQTFGNVLRGMGISDKHAESIIIANPDAEAAFENTVKLSDEFGAPLTAMALMQNAHALSGDGLAAKELLETYRRNADAFLKDQDAMERYRTVFDILNSRLKLHERQCALMLSAAADLCWSNDAMRDSLEQLLLLAGKSELGSVLLANPSILTGIHVVERVKRILEESGSLEGSARKSGERESESAKPAATSAPNAGATATGKQTETELGKQVMKIADSKGDGLELLGRALLKLGMESRFIEELNETRRYCNNPAKALRNLKALVRDHGAHTAMVLLYRNRGILDGSRGKSFGYVLRDIRNGAKDKEMRQRCRELISLMETEIGMPAAAINSALPNFARTNKSTPLLLSNIRLALKFVPRESVQRIIIEAPSRFYTHKAFMELLEEYGASAEIDEEACLAALTSLSKRPPMFMRRFVHENPLLALKSPEELLVHIEYKARSLLKSASDAGISSDVARECLEAGVMTIEEIISRRDSLAAGLAGLPKEEPVAQQEEARAPQEDKADKVQPEREYEDATVEDLRNALLEAGTDSAHVESLLQTKRYQEKPGTCISNIHALRAEHGDIVLLSAIYKNPGFMIDIRSPLIDAIAAEIQQVRENPKAMEKYARLIAEAASLLGVEGEWTFRLVSILLRTGISEDLALNNLKMLLRAGMPREELRAILLRSPSELYAARAMNSYLERYPLQTSLDQDAVVRAVMAVPKMSRPEGFVRAYVAANHAIADTRSTEKLADQIEYKARTMKRNARKKGVPEEFIQECIAKGMLTPGEIVDAHNGAQAPSEEDMQPETGDPPSRTEHQTSEQASAPAARDARSTLPEGEEADRLLMSIMMRAEPIGMSETVCNRMLSSQTRLCACGPRSESKARVFIFLRDNSQQLVNGTDEEFGEALERFADRCAEPQKRKPAGNGKPRAQKQVQNGTLAIPVAQGDEAMFSRISAIKAPEAESFFLSRQLDFHSFCYLVIKAFEWNGSRRQPDPLREERFRKNFAEFAGEAAEAAGEMLDGLTYMLDGPRVALKHESSLPPMQAEIVRLLKLARQKSWGKTDT